MSYITPTLNNLSSIASKLAVFHKLSEKALASIKGKGPRGLIMKADILEYINNPTPAAQAPPLSPEKKINKDTSAAYTDIDVSNIRKVIAERLLESKRTIPHYYLTEEVRMDKLMKLRADINNSLADQKNIKISVNDLIIKATALASLKVKEINTQWLGKNIRNYCNTII